MDYQALVNKAVDLQKQLLQNMISEPEIIDLSLQKEADLLHQVLFSSVPWHWFHLYVKTVHEQLERPYWLAGKPGVTTKLLEQIKVQSMLDELICK